MRRIILALSTFYIFSCHISTYGQNVQSAIYDAITLMNAKHGINVLLLPSIKSYDIIDPLSGYYLEKNVVTTNNKYLNDKDKSDIIIRTILARNAGLSEEATLEQIKKAYSDNPFLKDLLNSKDYLTDNKVELPTTLTGFLVASQSGAMGSNLLNNIANGASDFLLKRAKEEIAINIFEKFQKVIKRYPEFDVLFPKTYSLIQTFPSYEFSKSLDALKNALQTDLHSLIKHIGQLYDLPRYKLYNQKVPGLTFLFASSTLVSDLDTAVNLGQCLLDVQKQNYLNEKNNYSSMIQSICIMSASLRDIRFGESIDKTFTYIKSDLIIQVTHQQPLFYEELSGLYLGLIWQKVHTLSFTADGTNKTLGELLSPWVGNAKDCMEKVNQVLLQFNNLENTYQKIKSEEASTQQITGKNIRKVERYSLYAQMLGSGVNLMNVFVTSSNSNFSNRIHEIQQYYPSFSSSLISMVQNFQEQQYSLGIRDFDASLRLVAQFLEERMNDKKNWKILISEAQQKENDEKKGISVTLKTLQDRLSKLNTSSLDEEIKINSEAEKQELDKQILIIQEKLTQLDWTSRHASSWLKNISTIIDYFDLMASACSAENSAAFENLLETHALPAGSSRIKKVTPFSITFNAYVGGFFERSSEVGNGFTNSYGLTAPIGLALSKGFYKGGSISFFGGFLDLGGIIRYKLDNQGAYEQNISIAGIFSPSAQLVYGFPFYLPFSMGAGCQWISPTISATNEIQLTPHFNAFIAVDIPILNIKVLKK